ncbi:hypothetical protein FHR72_001994 [Mycolicibacterium iranicum]|uniref:Uncharacterized protein n=1 Tax=Mycolicibacterium iranicum TaxID=912594 RepID=A0A839Q8I0_MYCIR|nr:DUF6676 family protein [Mycolicibacterium iranicum]MBB2990526.1 hypothetical protein [Mycolicibacterium iranicum]
MSGLQFVPFVPTYIPPELCQSVGVAVEPGRPTPDACMEIVNRNVGQDGVSVPEGTNPKVEEQLVDVVKDAESRGIDLKIVVIGANPPIDTPLRDIATEVGEAHPGATVLALSPSFAGTYSADYDRSTLEAGEDLARTADPVQSSKNFVSELTTSHFPWTPFTIVLVLMVALAVVATRVLQKRGKRTADVKAASTSSD